MRFNRGRLGWSVVISLLGHGLVIALFCHFFNALRPSPTSPKDSVDCRIEKPKEYATIALSLDDRPPQPSRTEPKSLPKSPAPPPPIQPAELTNRGNASTSADSSPGPQTVGMGSGTTGVAPLHSKLTRPGMSIVYVLDCSGSMGRDRKLAQAIAALKASLRQLGPDVRFQIVTYDSRASISRIGRSLELAAASQANIEEADGHLDDLTGEGSSRHTEGLRAGLGLHPDLMILITDADDLSVQDVKLVKKLNQKGTTIHAVLIGSPAEEAASSLREVTGLGRVHFVSLPDPQRLGTPAE